MSAINEKTKTIFIHIPKTAGTSMEDMGFLGTVMTRHFGIDHYAEEVDLDKYFKFAFVRNPYDRLMSAVCGHAMVGQRVNNKTVNSFVEKNKVMLDKWIATKPQYTFIYINGELKVDFVGRFERLLEDWAKICKKLKVNETLTIPHSKRGLYPKDLKFSKENRELIRKVYRKDFEYFGYAK